MPWADQGLLGVTKWAKHGAAMPGGAKPRGAKPRGAKPRGAKPRGAKPRVGKIKGSQAWRRQAQSAWVE